MVLEATQRVVGGGQACDPPIEFQPGQPAALKPRLEKGSCVAAAGGEHEGMNVSSPVFLALLLVFSPQRDSPAERPALVRTDLPRWRTHLRPGADEMAYLEIDWISSFEEGLVRASAEARPLLFWAMNGHPLGCT